MLEFSCFINCLTIQTRDEIGGRCWMQFSDFLKCWMKFRFKPTDLVKITDPHFYYTHQLFSCFLSKSLAYQSGIYSVNIMLQTIKHYRRFLSRGEGKSDLLLFSKFFYLIPVCQNDVTRLCFLLLVPS